MGKLKNYDCHKQKYYVPQDKPKWAVLNLKQASTIIRRESQQRKMSAVYYNNKPVYTESV